MRKQGTDDTDTLLSLGQSCMHLSVPAYNVYDF